MDLIRPLVKHFTHDFYLRRDGFQLGSYRKQLKASQFISSDELASLQLRKLKHILAFAMTSNQFYRKRFKKCGFEPGEMREVSDLSKIPVLTKDDIRGGLIDTLSSGYTRESVRHKRTGGSTGVPLHVYIDYDSSALKMAAAERHNGWAGLTPGNRLAAVWGDTTKSLSLKERLRNALTTRALYLDTLNFSPPTIDLFLKKTLRYTPPILMGHAHSIFRLAEYVRDHSANKISFQGVITTAMVLSQSERSVIEEVFSTRVYNRYGCEELSIIASECNAHQGMHIFGEGLYLELIGPNENQPRPIVITDLTNRAMPLIRYEIGDYGIVDSSQCKCGRNLPRLLEVTGRTADFLYTPDRVPVFGISILDTFVIHIPGIKQVQIVQDLYDHIDFYVVRDKLFTENTVVLIKKNIAEIFSTRMRFDIHYIDKVKQTGMGKYRFSICNIPDELGKS